MHVNAELARTLRAFATTHVIDSGSEREARKKGLLAPDHDGSGLVLTTKGLDFLSKWK